MKDYSSTECPESCSVCKHEADCIIANSDEPDLQVSEIESLRQQLAECQATNWKLREALDAVQQVANRSEGIAGWHLNGDIASWDSILPEVDEALALPNDATALNELIAERTASLTSELQSTSLQMITDFGQYHEKVKELTAEVERKMSAGEFLIQQNAELTAEVEYWKNIRTENAVYFEKREAELTTHRDILTHELNYARERFNKAIRVLSGIHSLLYPPHFTDKDGKVLAFKSPIVEEQIQALSDKIRAIPDDISAIDAAIANCKEQG